VHKRAISLFRKLYGSKEVRRPTDRSRTRTRLSFSADDFSAIYAVGDIHGCYDQLVRAESRIRQDAVRYPGRILVVFLGDYVDRGARSREVLEYLADDPNDDLHIRRVVLCGNHDAAFLRVLNDPQTVGKWLRFAGDQTLRSYGIDASRIVSYKGSDGLNLALQEAVPQHHKQFLEDMPIMLQIGNLVFVHAGIRPGIPLSSQSDEDLLWIRQPFLTEGPQLPTLTVIHGHTPVNQPDFGKGRVGLDTGAFATGNLSVLRIIGNSAEIL
jgi:serine/threonine protein phosphatase 1